MEVIGNLNGESPEQNVIPRVLPGRVADYMLRVSREYNRRLIDPLRLYKALPEVEDFHKSNVRHRLLVGPNQIGKTLGVSVEVARTVRGRDPYAEHKGMPKKNGILLCVGKDGDHLGQVMWKKLSQPGAFKVIKDLETGALRPLRLMEGNPYKLDPSDAARKREWIKSAPLIPPNEIDEISWEEFKRRIPKLVRMRNGWELMFHTSKGSPRQGIQINAAWFDEEIDQENWFSETVPRMVHEGGLFFWSCTPQQSTQGLWDLHTKAEQGSKLHAEFNLDMEKFPYLSDQEKSDFLESLPEQDRAVRYYGEYAIVRRRVYPDYYPDTTHGISGHEEPPKEWMRLAAIDPGRQHLAVVFLAVPPEANEVHVYDEIYIEGATADKFADAMKKKMKGQSFEYLVIDHRMGTQQQMISGRSVEEHYHSALEERGLWNQVTHKNFYWGSMDIDGRTESLQNWMARDGAGDSVLKIYRDRCPTLHREIPGQYYKRDQPDLRDKRVVVGDHATTCLEYLAAFFDEGLYYEPPMTLKNEDDDEMWAVKEFKKKRERLERKARAEGVGSVRLG